MFISAKDLLVEAIGPTGPGTKTFEIDQSFEPGVSCNRLGRTRHAMTGAYATRFVQKMTGVAVMAVTERLRGN